MSIKVAVFNDKIDLADELEDDFHQTAKDAVGEGADILLDAFQRKLRQRPGTKRTSAPAGESPEEDTGHLAASFRKIPPRIRGRVASSGVQSDDPGANRVEFGATDVRGIRTFPHPYAAPAMAESEAPIDALLQERLK